MSSLDVLPLKCSMTSAVGCTYVMACQVVSPEGNGSFENANLRVGKLGVHLTHDASHASGYRQSVLPIGTDLSMRV